MRIVTATLAVICVVLAVIVLLASIGGAGVGPLELLVVLLLGGAAVLLGRHAERTPSRR
jgi:hypothetical protein